MQLKSATQSLSVDALLAEQADVAPLSTELEAALKRLEGLEGVRVLRQGGGDFAILSEDGERLAASDLARRLNVAEPLLDPVQQSVLLRALTDSAEAQSGPVVVPGGQMGAVGSALLAAAAVVTAGGSGVLLQPLLESLRAAGPAGEVLAALLGVSVLFGSPGAFAYVWARLDGRLDPAEAKRHKSAVDEDLFV